MSGVNEVLATRYGADNWRIARSNVAFSATLTAVAVDDEQLPAVGRRDALEEGQLALPVDERPHLAAMARTFSQVTFS